MPDTGTDHTRSNAAKIDISHLGPAALQRLYVSEREQSQTIRSQLAIPVSIISFSALGLVTLTKDLDASRWADPVMGVVLFFTAIAVALVLGAMRYLWRVERIFLRSGPHSVEDNSRGGDEAGYFLDAITKMREQNDVASRCRARALFLLLGSLASLLAAASLLPLH